MTFQQEKVTEFLEMFDGVKSKIRAFEGCEYLELWQDADQPNVYLTHSHWQNPEALENYRHSELFKATWAKTKVSFADKPIAFSVNSITKLS
jgi:heme-degrading monooxygenase HmoA